MLSAPSHHAQVLPGARGSLERLTRDRTVTVRWDDGSRTTIPLGELKLTRIDEPVDPGKPVVHLTPEEVGDVYRVLAIAQQSLVEAYGPRRGREVGKMAAVGVHRAETDSEAFAALQSYVTLRRVP
jgi:hypothetical protein